MSTNHNDLKKLVELYESKRFDLAKSKVENLIKKEKSNPVLFNIYGLILAKENSKLILTIELNQQLTFR